MASPLAQPARLTDPQYRALSLAADRGDNLVVRTLDASEATLRSLAARNIGTLEYDVVGRRQIVAGLYVTFAGWLVWSRERDARTRAEQAARNAAIKVDPFAVHADTREARTAAAIDMAFSS